MRNIHMDDIYIFLLEVITSVKNFKLKRVTQK